MSELLDRLRALRGDAAAATPAVQEDADPRYQGAAVQLGARSVVAAEGVHLLRRGHCPPSARHGRSPLGGAGIHPWLTRTPSAGRARACSAGAGASAEDANARGIPSTPSRASAEGRVLYLDTETTGLAGGAGTFAFLIGVGVHEPDGFVVSQLFLPGPEHERAQLSALAELVRGASAVVTYNGSTFDLPLLRTRFALHRLPDPLAGVAAVDLLHPVRRLWRGRLPDCTLATVERELLGACRSVRDVPGAEVPERYFAFLRSRDARPLRGVLQHNHDDVVALTALRRRLEDLLSERRAADGDESHALGRWLERIGEPQAALARYAASDAPEAAWDAALLSRRLGREDQALALWRGLGRRGVARAWVEVAKIQEHRKGDPAAALASVAEAARLPGPAGDDLERRRRRLLRKLAAVAPAESS